MTFFKVAICFPTLLTAGFLTACGQTNNSVYGGNNADRSRAVGSVLQRSAAPTPTDTPTPNINPTPTELPVVDIRPLVDCGANDLDCYDANHNPWKQNDIVDQIYPTIKTNAPPSPAPETRHEPGVTGTPAPTKDTSPAKATTPTK